MTPPLLHIGYHKTATTWMQRRLFTREHGFEPLLTHKEVFDHVVAPHGLAFDASAPQALLAERAPAEGTPVVSSEILSGHPFYGGLGSDVYARRLHQIAPDARILVSIRNQLQLLPSIYMQYLLRGGTQPPDQFFEGTSEPGYFGFSALHFEYDRLVALYQSLFGPENVLVVTQEHLQSDIDGFARKIADFAGNTRFDGLTRDAKSVQSPSYPQYAAPALRRVNHFQKSTLNPAPVVRLGQTPTGLYRVVGSASKRPPVSRLFRRRKPVSDYVRSAFSGRFADSNRRLAALVGDRTDVSAYA